MKIKLFNYISQLTKEGIITPAEGQRIMKEYVKSRNLEDFVAELVLIPVPEGKEEFFSLFLNRLLSDEDIYQKQKKETSIQSLFWREEAS